MGRVTNLEDHSAFEHDQHEESEETVVPVLIQAPEGDTKDLEDEKGGRRVFAEQLGEGRNRDIEFVLSKHRN